MKRILRTLTLAALTACLLAVSALADSGPKPLLTVTVEHPPEGVYYLDLLAEGPPYDEGYRTEADFAALDQGLLQAMRDAVPEGWHLCILDGDLIFGDLTGEPQGDAMIHTFSYYGVPDTYRILIAAESESGAVAAFAGVENRRIEMLFVAPERRGAGIGKALLRYAVRAFGADEVTVNEQNAQAVGFYEHMGFTAYRRTDTDEQGGPYPLLYMRL